MNKYLNWIPNELLTVIISILFIALWPLIFILIGLNSLFSKKTTAKEKITGAKIAIITLITMMALGIFSIYEYSLIKYFYIFPWRSLFIFLLVGLFILAILQKIFPNWSFLKK